MLKISNLRKSGGSLLVLSLLQVQTAFAATENVVPEQPANQQTSSDKNDSGLDLAAKEQVAQLECCYFEHDFHSDVMVDRLARLEQLLFGETRPGSIDERLKSVQKIATKAANEDKLMAPATSSSAAGSANNNSGANVLGQLERHYFNHDFHSDSQPDRLTRLEQLAFGAEKKGSVDIRLKSIEASLGGTWLNYPGKITLKGTDTSSISSTTAGGKKKETFQTALDSGIGEFKAQRFHHAQDEFERAISLNPRSAEAYADLGGALLMLRDRQGAEEAFKACYSLQPFGKLGAYAREQILKLASAQAYEKTDPQDSPQTVERTVRMINRQTADRSRIYQTEATKIANHRINLTNIEIARMTDETQQALNDLRARGAYPTYNRNGVPRYHRGGRYGDPYDQQEISNMNYIRTNYLRTDGEVQANIALSDGLSRGTSIFDAGTSLKDQLLQPVQPGGARLRALGTSLYARYYGDGVPSIDEPPMVDPVANGLEATAKSLKH